MPWFQLGYQWDCTLDPCPASRDIGREPRMGDCFENPDRRARVFAEARHHARRTGHAVIVDRHSRFIIEPRNKKGGDA